MYRTILLSLTLLLAAATSLNAQQKPLSPRDSVSLTLDTNTISVKYGRPSMRGRTIMGDLVPWNKVWRTGANEATHLATNFDMLIGGVPLPRGKYTFWTLPSPLGWKMIINKQTGQWGTKYDESQDFARFDPVIAQTSAPVETLTIALSATGPTSGMLTLTWERTSLSTTFQKNDKIRPISPLDSAVVNIGGNSIKVKHSKPFMRGRKIWGGVVPMDSVWRTGANSATVFSTEKNLCFGKKCIPQGSYTLYSAPGEGSLVLIVSKKGPGRAEYDKSQDLLRIDMVREKATGTIDPFKIWFEQTGTASGRLKLGWDDRVYAADFTVQP